MEKQTIKCIICNGTNTDYLSKVLGYDSSTYYSTYKCHNCNCHYINTDDINKDIYDIIYKDSDKIGGYERYHKYFEQIKKSNKPLERLSNNDHIYGIVSNYLKDKKGYKCLEIGCGLGYLTYAINNSGNTCIGYDLSENSIIEAKKQFGEEFYYNGDAFENIDKDEQYDVIIATEVIEHLDNYDNFFLNCKKLCKKDGVIILTTPNKDFYKDNSIWIGDLPPVHTTWRSKKTFDYICGAYNFTSEFYPIANYHNDKNYLYAKLYHYIITGTISKPHFNRTISTNDNSKDHNGSFIDSFVNLNIVKSVSNFLVTMLYGKINSSQTLGCILKNK